MKSIMLIFSVFVLFSFSAHSQSFKKLDKANVDEKKVQLAKEFANEYLMKQKTGSYYQFKDEAIDAIKDQLTPENQKIIYQQLKEKFGDYKSLEYAETWVPNGNSGLKIFRFKGDFEKSNRKLEIRVVLNANDKIAGFWIRPWSDMLN